MKLRENVFKWLSSVWHVVNIYQVPIKWSVLTKEFTEELGTLKAHEITVINTRQNTIGA